jgi:hypothetical protein
MLINIQVKRADKHKRLSTMSKITGYWVSSYVDKLNKACASSDEHKVSWTIDDLQPNNIRRYCKKYDYDKQKMCWSCGDYLAKYLIDLEHYEKNISSTNDILKIILEKQESLSAKLDTLLSLMNK